MTLRSVTPGGSLRLVAVAFCDLVDSTSTMAHLPPERWGQALERYYEIVGTELAGSGARLEKFIGDAVVAVSGVGVDADPDPDALVRATVRAVEAVGADRRLKAIVPGGGLTARAAVVSGRVLLDLTRDSTFAVGRVMHRAARLQGAAEPGGVVTDLVTRLLLRDRIPTTALPPRRLHGFAQPVPLFSVGRDDGGPRAGIVDRVDDLAVLLAEVGARLDGGPAGWIRVAGAAGIGKTRLMEELAQALGRRGVRSAGVGCRVSGAQEFTLILELIAALDPHGPALVAGPGVMRADLLARLHRQAEALLAEGGLVLTIDDVQGLTEFEAGSLAEALQALPPEVVVVLVGRTVPDPLAASAGVDVRVGPLSAGHLEELWDAVVGDVELHAAGAAVRPDAVRRSAGNPLFLKELALLAGSGEPVDSNLPPSAELVIEHLLRRLSARAVDLLSMVAVTGGTLETADFVRLFGSEPDVDSIVLEATEAGLLVISPAGLAHESRLQTEVLRARLPLAGRARLHARVAEALGFRLEQAPQVLEQIAEHRTSAARAWDEFDPESEDARSTARLAAGTLLRLAGFVGGRGDNSRAGRLLTEAGHWAGEDPRLLATIAALRSAVALAGGDSAGAERIALEAAATPGEIGPSARAHLAARHARARIVAGLEVPAALRVTIREAMQTPLEDDVAVACLLDEGYVAAISGDYPTAEVQLRRARSHLRSALGGIDGPEVHGNLGLFLLLGDTPAEPAAQACAALVEELRDGDLLRAALCCPYALLEDAAGRPEHATRLLDHAEELFAALGHELGRHAVRDFRVDALVRRGLMAEAAGLLQAAMDDYRAAGRTRDVTRAALMLAILQDGEIPAPAADEPGDWMVEVLHCLARAGDRGRSTAERGRAVEGALAVMARIRGAGARIVPLVLAAWLVRTGRIEDGAALGEAARQAAAAKADVVARATLESWRPPRT